MEVVFEISRRFSLSLSLFSSVDKSSVRKLSIYACCALTTQELSVFILSVRRYFPAKNIKNTPKNAIEDIMRIFIADENRDTILFLIY